VRVRLTYPVPVEVIASPAAVELVQERGGELFVWSKTSRCCHGAVSFLDTTTSRDDHHGFQRLPADGIELYVDFPRLPERLEIDLVGRRHRRVAAYWEGCAWVS